MDTGSGYTVATHSYIWLLEMCEDKEFHLNQLWKLVRKKKVSCKCLCMGHLILIHILSKAVPQSTVWKGCFHYLVCEENRPIKNSCASLGLFLMTRNLVINQKKLVLWMRNHTGDGVWPFVILKIFGENFKITLLTIKEMGKLWECSSWF